MISRVDQINRWYTEMCNDYGYGYGYVYDS